MTHTYNLLAVTEIDIDRHYASMLSLGVFASAGRILSDLSVVLQHHYDECPVTSPTGETDDDAAIAYLKNQCEMLTNRLPDVTEMTDAGDLVVRHLGLTAPAWNVVDAACKARRAA